MLTINSIHPLQITTSSAHLCSVQAFGWPIPHREFSLLTLLLVTGVLLKWVIMEHTGPTALWTICLGALPSAVLHFGRAGQEPRAGPRYPWTRGRGEISGSKGRKWQGRWQNGGICQKQEARGSCREENNSRTYWQSSKQGFLRALGKRKVKTIFPVMAIWGRRCGTDFLRKL